MENFLENVNTYIKSHHLKLSARIENKITHKNLILKEENGEDKTYKIETLKMLPPTNMCHSNISFITINPYAQTEKWLETKLKENFSIKNTIKLK